MCLPVDHTKKSSSINIIAFDLRDTAIFIKKFYVLDIFFITWNVFTTQVLHQKCSVSSKMYKFDMKCRAGIFFFHFYGACESMMRWDCTSCLDSRSTGLRTLMIMVKSEQCHLLSVEPFHISPGSSPPSPLLCRATGRVRRHNTCVHNLCVVMEFGAIIIKIKTNSTW